MPSKNGRRPAAELPPGSRVYGYARDSGGTQQERSVGQQVEAIRDYCRERGWILAAEVYTDEARSGGSDVGRTGLSALLQAAQAGQGAAVVFWSSSRFARDVDDAQFYRSTLRRRGYALVYVSDPLPEAGAYTPLLETVKDIGNQEYRTNLARDVRRGLHALTAQGFAAGPVPIGYKRETVEHGQRRDGSPRRLGRWIVDPVAAPRVRQAWAMRAAGRTITDIHIATELFPGGSRNGYFHLFRNEIYRGVRVYGGQRYEGFVEPLCTEAQWRAVQARQLACLAHTPGTHPRRAFSTYLLSGLAYCGLCGSPLNGGRTQERYGNSRRYYACRKRRRHGAVDGVGCTLKYIPADELDGAVVAEVLSYFSPENLDDLQAQWQAAALAASADREAGLSQKRADLAEAERRIARLLDQLEAGASVVGRLAERETERDALARQITALEYATGPDGAPVAPADQAQAAADLREMFSTGDAHAARAILAGLLTQVVIHPEPLGVRLEYHWRP